MTCNKCVFFTLILFMAGFAHAAPPQTLEAQVNDLKSRYTERGQGKISKVMVLGTFHFVPSKNDGRTVNIDILSDKRQKEIAAVLDGLEAFAPTKIGVEIKANRQEELTAGYTRYLESQSGVSPNEFFQIGYQLAKRLGHTDIHAIDANGRWLGDRKTVQGETRTIARDQGLTKLQKDPVKNGWSAMSNLRKKWINDLSLMDFLLLANDPRVLRMSHSIYLTRDKSISDGINYPLADGFVSQWYNRNIRMYANILRLAEMSNNKGQERILIIVGYGHVPIIRHLIENSGSLELVEISTVLHSEN